MSDAKAWGWALLTVALLVVAGIACGLPFVSLFGPQVLPWGALVFVGAVLVAHIVLLWQTQEDLDRERVECRRLRDWISRR